MECLHNPPCPPADAPDADAARVTAHHEEQGYSRLCNGVITFNDTGELLPDGDAESGVRVVEPHRGPARHRLVAA